MKQFQIAYENRPGFEKWLAEIQTKSEGVSPSNIVFYMTWMRNADTNLPDITDAIQVLFPHSLYYGNEASGNISMGHLTYGINISCYVFERPNSRAELLWVEQGTEMSSLSDLWDYCNTKDDLRGVELIPSLAYLDVLGIDGSELPLRDDIMVFGGASVNYDFDPQGGDIIASGHPMTRMGMAVMLYYGEDLHFYSNDILGWKGLGRLMEVTKSSGKVIEEIENVPAYSIYEKYLDLTMEESAETVVFPLIVEDGRNLFLRTPQLVRPDKSLQMFVQIPVGAQVRIAYGDQNTILARLHEAAAEIAAFQPEAIKAFSCAARRLFWSDAEVSKETDIIEAVAPINGFYTGGEILRFDNKIRVLNQTLAIVALREKDLDESVGPTELDNAFGKKSLVARLTFFSEKVVEEVLESQAKLQEDARVIGALAESFGYVDYVEITEDQYTDVAIHIREAELLNELIPGWKEEIHFTRRMELLVENLVYDQDRAMVREKVSRQTIMSALEHSDTYFLTARGVLRGKVEYFQLQVSAVRDQGKIIGVVAALRSVDEQKRKELETQEELKLAKQEAELANRSKSEFLFNMSHDIRTPMNAITGFTAMVKKYADDGDRVRDYIEKIDISGRQLLTLINQVLEMSRIETGKVDFVMNPVDIRERFQAMVTVLSAQAHAKGLTFKSSMHDIHHRHVYSDDTKVGQITLNIVGNALKYTPEGGCIDFILREVDSREEGFASFVFTVKDNGIGMSKDFLEKIFEPFSREKNSTVSRIQGTGLGMTIVQKLVKLMGGDIAIDSQPGEGTRFDVLLDFKIADEANCTDTNVIDPDFSTASFAGKRVLLVEDNEMNREIAKDMLEEFGFLIEEADDGDVAVAMCKEAAERGDFGYYDYILMDIQMPHMSGYEATREIRAIPAPDDVHVPIFAMTANAFEEDRRNALEAGMDEHLSKPIEIMKLLETFAKFS